MPKVSLDCNYCGKLIEKYPCQIKAHNFCSRTCLGHFASKKTNPEGYNYRDFSVNSKRFSEMNRQINPTRMTAETRIKISLSMRNAAECQGYPKLFGRHIHRTVAELKLGRLLRRGEVVHHIDGNKQNYDASNLEVFPSQAEHCRYHQLQEGSVVK